jgi:hypothetical protein
MKQALYQLWPQDQPNFNWLTRVPDDQSGWALRPRYAKLTCKSCGRLNLDAVFAEGFDPHIKFKVKKGRTAFMTEDHFLCMHDDLVNALSQAHVAGYEAKPLPEMPWHVLRITERRAFDESVYQAEGRRCAACGRVDEYRILQFERHIEPPAVEVTFFSTNRERGQGGYDLFVTAALLELLKGAGFKGAEFHKLYSADEESVAVQHWAKQQSFKPKGSVIAL